MPSARTKDCREAPSHASATAETRLVRSCRDPAATCSSAHRSALHTLSLAIGALLRGARRVLLDRGRPPPRRARLPSSAERARSRSARPRYHGRATLGRLLDEGTLSVRDACGAQRTRLESGTGRRVEGRPTRRGEGVGFDLIGRTTIRRSLSIPAFVSRLSLFVSAAVSSEQQQQKLQREERPGQERRVPERIGTRPEEPIIGARPAPATAPPVCSR